MGAQVVRALAGGLLALLALNALVSLFQMAIWSMMALLAAGVAGSLVAAQAALLYVALARLAARLRDLTEELELGIWDLVWTALVAASLVAPAVAWIQLLAPGLPGRLLLPCLAVAEATMAWLLSSWSPQMPDVLGWRPGIAAVPPAVPWGHPVLLAVASIPPFLGLAILILEVQRSLLQGGQGHGDQ